MNGAAGAGRQSLLWRLLAVLVVSVLVTFWLANAWNRMVELDTAYLPAEDRQELAGFARDAQGAWEQGGAAGARAWLDGFRAREGVWAVLVDQELQPLDGSRLTAEDRQRLTFLRRLDTPVRRNRFNTVPDVVVPLPNPEAGSLALRLPQRYLHDQRWPVYRWLSLVLPPLALFALLGIYLHRHLVVPLRLLRQQASNLKGDQLEPRLPAALCQRRDELGELSGAFNHMSDRLQGVIEFQRQLLRDLSHEMRTPLSRLGVALESSRDLPGLQQRVEQEMATMTRLVDNTLKLAWLDTEKPQVQLEPVSLPRLWDLITEDASFESGWDLARMPCRLGDDCLVMGDLNGLYHALENLLRNAIRHSPPQGKVYLEGECTEGHWLISIRDEGPGVAPDQLQQIFEPFVRLNGARPSDGGFGLGLSIARSALALQGVTLTAVNAHPGLCLRMRLPRASGSDHAAGRVRR